MKDNELVVFQKELDEESLSIDNELEQYWHLLIIDDDIEVHTVTLLTLRNVEIFGKKIKFYSAESAEQAKALLQENIPFALALIDVVMETETAGLDLIHWIRNVNKNEHIRLVLRTGQPGQAPEKDIITHYDINDYKEKTELTSTKLYTLTYACLRAYRDIIALYEHKDALEAIIRSSNKIFAHQTLNDFTKGLLQQLCTLFHIEAGAKFSNVNSFAAFNRGSVCKIIAATGRFDGFLNHTLEEVIAFLGDKLIKEQCNQSGECYGDNYFIGVYDSHLNGNNIFYIEGIKDISNLDRQLIEIFGTNIGVAFDNQIMYEELETTQREMIYRMSEAVESRSKETSNHVKRVALTCQYLARAIGMSDKEVDIIYKAAPLHDIGKIAIPDNILNKPAKLNDDEWLKMKTHAQIGHDILASSELTVLRAGAIIAGEHHENWDGSGYPHGKKREEIHIYGRITAVADVFDALVNKRCYKVAWTLGETMTFFKQMSALKFDPSLVDTLIECKVDLMAIQDKYKD